MALLIEMLIVMVVSIPQAPTNLTCMRDLEACCEQSDRLAKELMKDIKELKATIDLLLEQIGRDIVEIEKYIRREEQRSKALKQENEMLRKKINESLKLQKK